MYKQEVKEKAKSVYNFRIYKVLSYNMPDI